jgi:ABC-type antimicrobial peptide transport system permease subunit
MIEQIRFYFGHSLNDLRVNGQRTFFALLCIAAGVAAIVSLQTLAVMIGDTLTTNLQESNRGDIQLRLDPTLNMGQAKGFRNSGETEDLLAQAVESGVLEEVSVTNPFAASAAAKTYRLSPGGVEQIQTWLDEHYPGQTQITYPVVITDLIGMFFGNGLGTSINVPETGTSASQLSPFIIDAHVYPFYGQVVSLDGQPLAEMIQSPTDIVIDKKVADTLGVKVGDTVRVSGADADFTVRGIVPTESEVTDPETGFLAALFGFYYLDQDALQYFGNIPAATERLYLKINDPALVSEIDLALSKQYPFLQTTTIDDLRVQNEEIASQISQLVTVMGLVSLLLGSIGIINTMQVIVRRRTVEVAVLKTLGLQANQVTILFLVEAFIMGVVGSILGILLGWATTFLIKGVAENLVAQQIPFRIALAPVVNGLIVGTLVTTIFGFLPTLAAGQVRPGVVLRPNDTIIPRAGFLRTLLALVVIILAISFIAQTILGSFTTALAVTVGAFIAAGFLLLLLSFLIWLVGRFVPSLGIVDLKISLRQMLAGRGRAAMTLLALVVGIFSLSLITLLADSVNRLMEYALGEGSGGNVLVFASSESAIERAQQIVASTDGVQSYQVFRSYNGHLISLEESDGTVLNTEGLKARINQNSNLEQTAAMFGAPVEDIDFSESLLASLGDVTAIEPDQPSGKKLSAGRDFAAEDINQPLLVVEDNESVRSAGITVGDKLTFRFGDEPDAPTATYEVIGIYERALIQGGFGGTGVNVPVGVVPEGVQPQRNQLLVGIGEEQIPALRRQIGAIPGTFVLETAIFTKLIEGLLGTFTAFPTMVALLGLIVGGVVIANSVALSTLERRREIAVMKAVGLQRERVLSMILLENGILGLIGGLIGVGIGLLGLVLMISTASGPGQLIPYGTALLLMLLCVAVALVAAVTTAWGASGEKPLNVVRYE